MQHPEVLGMVAGALTTLAFLPQVVHTWRRRSASDLSLAWLLTFSAGVALWLAYGLAIGSRPIVVANTVTLSLVLLILYFRLRYR